MRGLTLGLDLASASPMFHVKHIPRLSTGLTASRGTPMLASSLAVPREQHVSRTTRRDARGKLIVGE